MRLTRFPWGISRSEPALLHHGFRSSLDGPMKHRLHSLAGSAAVVTGASSGIGRSLALHLASQGARVGLVARRQDELERVAKAVRMRGGKAVIASCDVTDRVQVDNAAQELRERLGDIDLLVNNAGIGHRQPFLETDPELFERMFRIHTLGAVHFTRALLPAMVARERGWLVFVASVAGRVPTPNETAYVASKFAMVGFAESLSLEIEDSGVHVLVVCPGIVDTPFFGAGGPPRLAGPFTRPIDPDALAHAIVGALSKGARSLTVPRAMAGAYLAQAIAPEFTRAQVKRSATDEP